MSLVPASVSTSHTGHRPQTRTPATPTAGETAALIRSSHMRRCERLGLGMRDVVDRLGAMPTRGLTHAQLHTIVDAMFALDALMASIADIASPDVVPPLRDLAAPAKVGTPSA